MIELGKKVKMDCLKWNNDAYLIRFDENGMATHKKIDTASFPKGRPICCGMEMYRCGGTVGKTIQKGHESYFRCDVCGKENTDIAL